MQEKPLALLDELQANAGDNRGRDGEYLSDQIKPIQDEVARLVESQRNMAEGRKVCMGILLIATGYMPEGVSNGLRALVAERDAMKDEICALKRQITEGNGAK